MNDALWVALRLALGAALCGSVAFTLMSLVCVLRFRFGRGSEGEGRRDVPPPGGWVPVTLLKPVHAPDLGRDEVGVAGRRGALAENLASMFAQDYPEYEILFGFQDPLDPAIAVVEEVQASYPDVPSRVVLVPEARGPNRKASVLAALQRVARHPVLVVSDQDMRVGPGYLRGVVAGFDTDQVGLVTCPYRTRRIPNPAAVFEALTVNVDFIPSALVARCLEGLTFALGATMAPRRDALEAIGGFEALEPYLADDYQLGNRIHRAGLSLALSPYPVDNILPPTSFATYFLHQLRWARTYRVCRPVGYFFSVIMNGTVFALALLAALGFSVLGWRILGAWLLLRIGTALVHQHRLTGEWAQVPWLMALPAKDLAAFAIWLMAISGQEVRWGEHRFRLHADGTMHEVGAS